MIQLGDIPVVLSQPFIFQVGIGCHEPLGRLDWKVRFVCPDGDKEGDLRVLAILQPANHFPGSNHRTGAFDPPGWLAIAHVVNRVEMMGGGIILGCKPVVVAVIARLGLLVGIEVTV